MFILAKLADIYTANTVIYKFVDNYFIPFQSFDINGINEWIPIIVCLISVNQILNFIITIIAGSQRRICFVS